MTAMRLDRVDKDCYRVLGEDGQIAAFALRLATEKWGAFAADFDTRLGSRFKQFDKPKDVLAWLEQNPEELARPEASPGPEPGEPPAPK